MLGKLLESRGLSYDLVVVGGGALLLQGLIQRPTADLDTIARVEGNRWVTAEPLPEPLVEAIQDVGKALALPLEAREGKDWLNAGPTFLHTLGLPKGFKERTTNLTFASTIIRVASRLDLICLKFFAATDPQRKPRDRDDIADLKQLNPTVEELRFAIDWCAGIDGRSNFFAMDAIPVLRQLGVAPEDIGR